MIFSNSESLAGKQNIVVGQSFIEYVKSSLLVLYWSKWCWPIWEKCKFKSSISTGKSFFIWVFVICLKESKICLLVGFDPIFLFNSCLLHVLIDFVTSLRMLTYAFFVFRWRMLQIPLEQFISLHNLFANFRICCLPISCHWNHSKTGKSLNCFWNNFWYAFKCFIHVNGLSTFEFLTQKKQILEMNFFVWKYAIIANFNCLERCVVFTLKKGLQFC